MKLKLVSDWKSVHKHISFGCMSLFIGLCEVYNHLPQNFQNSFSPNELRYGAMALISLGIIGKYINQRPSDAKDSDNA